MANRAMTLLAGAAVLATSQAAAAQSWDGRSLPREGACFYRDVNYRGDFFCVEPGDDLGTMPPGANDRVSSIRILGRTEVAVFEDPRFRGDSLVFDSSVRDLRSENFNDLISSIQIRRTPFGFRGRGNRPSFERPQNPDVIVRRAYQDILERSPDPAGLRLYRGRLIDEGWTEQEVRDALRNSPEYRVLMRAKADEVVRRAYLAVLRREPDSRSVGYVSRVLRDGWTQQDVERALRQSPEFRNR